MISLTSCEENMSGFVFARWVVDRVVIHEAQNRFHAGSQQVNCLQRRVCLPVTLKHFDHYSYNSKQAAMVNGAAFSYLN